jgi:hypothetical protein
MAASKAKTIQCRWLNTKINSQLFACKRLKPFEQSLNVITRHHGNPDHKAGV